MICVQSWQAADDYANDVVQGRIVSGKHAKTACQRYLNDRKRDDLYFDKDQVNAVIKFAGRMRHVKGPLAGQPILLLQWMVFVLANIVGFYWVESGERRFNKALVLVARGNAKSFLCSIVAAWTMLTSKNGKPSCYSVAKNAQQARIVFDDCKDMIRTSHSSIKKRFKLLSHQIKSTHNNGEFRYLSSDSGSHDGLRVALGICDEMHTLNSASIVNVLKSGMSSTVDPLLFMISTAGTNLNGICYEQVQFARLINQGIQTDDSYFAIEFSIDDSDKWDDPEVWIKSNPSLGHAVNVSYLKAEVINAKQTVAARNDFMTKYCNMFVNSNEGAFIDVLKLQKCVVPTLPESEKVRLECYIGMDLAQKSDLAALTFSWVLDGGGIYSEHKHFIPQDAVDQSPPQVQAVYNQARNDGELDVMREAATDFSVIEDIIRDYCKRYTVVGVGFDPYNAQQMSLKLTAERIPMISVSQTIANMSEPSKVLQALILTGEYQYQQNRLFEWCCANAVMWTDVNENWKVRKSKSKPFNKCDSVVSQICALSIATLHETKRNAYEERGMISI